MSLRTCPLFLIPFLLAVSTVAASPHQTLKSPERVTHEFYRWYVREVNAGRYPLGHPQTMSSYLTARLIREINRWNRIAEQHPGQVYVEELDADYFTCLQEYPRDWEQKMVIVAITSTPNSPAFYVEKPPYKIKVTLQKEANVWKIDRAQCGSP